MHPTRILGVASLLAALAIAQSNGVKAPSAGTDSGPTTRAESRPAPAPDDPRAREILQRAVQAQAVGGERVVVQDFQADLQVTLYQADEQTKERHPHSAAVVEFWKRMENGRAQYRRHLIDLGGKTTIHGFNGKFYWQKLGAEPATELRSRETQEDVRRIREEIGRTSEFVSVMVLANLDEAGARWSLSPTARVKTNGVEREVRGIIREKAGERPIELLLGTKDDRLYAFTRMPDENHPKESILFAVHQPIGEGRSRILLPQKIEYRENDVLTLEAAVNTPTDIKFNTGIADEVFQPPR